MKTLFNPRFRPSTITRWRIFTLNTLLCLFTSGLFAQAPSLLGYQAVVRDAAGIPLAETVVTVRIGIHGATPGGPLLWQEDHVLTTTPQGLVSLEIGHAENRSGGELAEFFMIEWGGSAHFLEVQVNTGSGFTGMGTTELVSVPYALYAREAGDTPLSGVWSAQGEIVSTPFSVGIGTETPAGKLEVQGNPGAQDDDPLFEVKRNDGQPVLSVYNEGVRIWVQDDWVKGTKGGFAVGGFNPAKGETNEFLRVTPDSVRIYVENPESKASKGGFAVGGFTPAKATAEPLMQLTRDNYFLGHRSGVAITSGIYNAFIGFEAGAANTTGSNNVFLGYEAGKMNAFGDNNVFMGNKTGLNNLGGSNNTILGSEAGYNNSGGNKNTFIGQRAGFANTNGGQNVFIGDESGQAHRTGYYNIFIGTNAGYSNTEGSSNVFIGQNAGLANTGSGNIFLGPNAGRDETGSNMLYIDNAISDKTKTLIWGDFEQDHLRLNAFVGVLKEPVNGIAMDINGDLRVNEELITGSDARFKTAVEPLDHALDQVTLLQGVRYEWNQEAFPDKQFSEGKHLGLIAQEVEQVVPELVETGSDGYKAVNYNKLPALLVEAIKEQQAQIEAQAEKISMLEAMVEKLMEER